MENISDALKMAFALIVFAIAITTIFVMVSKVKTTSDAVFYYSDKTNFQEQYPYTVENREVTVSDIIATLYRYYKESVAVTVVLEKDATGKPNPNKTYYFDLGYEKMGTLNHLLIKDGAGNDLVKVSKQEDIEKNLGEFISENLIKSTYKKSKFTEKFTEVPTSGIYSTGNDGSEIVLSSGGKKVYITYTIK